MPEVSSIAQVVQIGVEVTPGTTVPATKKLVSLSLEPSPDMSVSTFKPAGQKYTTTAILNRESTKIAVSGIPTYDEIIYLLNSVLCAGVITTPATGVTARLHTFAPSSTLPDVVKTYSVEKGDAAKAYKMAYMLFTGFGLDIGKDDVTLSGTAIAKAIVTGGALSVGTTQLALKPIARKHFSLYLNDTYGTIGTTKLARAFTGSIELSDRFAGVYPIDAALAGNYAAHVETDPKLGGKLLVEADAAGDALVASLRVGTTKYLRIEAIGDIIELALPYRLTVDSAVKLTNIGGLSDEEGVYAIDFEYENVTDSALGGALKVEVQNTITAL